MKNSTFMKGLFATSLAFLCANMPASAQDVVEEEPQDSVAETVQTVYQMVDHITSGKTYVMGIFTNEGSWMAAAPPVDFGFYYPAYGRLLCEKSFELNDQMQIIPDPEVYLPSFTITEDEKGTIIRCASGSYLGVYKPYDDGKDDDKDEGKDDGKDQSMEYSYLIDTAFVADYYWDITYDKTLDGFSIKNRGTSTTLGVDFDMMTTEYEDGVEVTYAYRVVPYETLPEDMVAPIYLFELKDIAETGIESAQMDESKEPKKVYTLSGVLVGNTTNGLNPGIYVVKQGTSVKKIMVR